MSKDNERESILQAVKERVKRSAEHQLTQLIANAIGERRYRDLKDILSQIEQDRGWPQTLKHITKARNLSYILPIGAGPNMTPIENLKYREAIFIILDCSGFEPISLTTEDVLSRLKNEDSLIDASQSIHTKCESLAIRQIESGDTLFFDQIHFDRDIIQLLEKIQHEEIASLSLEKKDGTIDVLPLWYCEKGRQALSQLGIKGTKIDVESFEIVISVIHQNIHITNSIETQTAKKTLIRPSNSLYESLLTSIINQDIKSLCAISSKHSYQTLKSMLKNTLDYYEKHSSSTSFRNILSCVNAHVRIRSLESIILFEELSHSKDIRIATIAVTALGNFYNESAATALIDLLCKTKNREVANTAMRAIQNISKKCFETKYVVMNAINSIKCTNIGRLKRLYKEIWKEKDEYYL